MTTVERRQPRFRYHLRTLLGLALMCSILCSWLAVKIQRVRENREAVRAILELGGRLEYDYEFDADGFREPAAEPPERSRMEELLWNSFLYNVDNVRGVQIQGQHVTDAGIANVRDMTYLIQLSLPYTQVDDAGLDNLASMTRLKRLSVPGSRVTDKGLEKLRWMTQLEVLDLEDTEVTDEGLENLHGMTNLKDLYLSRTRVTDAGLEHLTELKRLERLDLAETKLTDIGLKRVSGMEGLVVLNIQNTNVTDKGLEHIKKLPQLRQLLLNGTKVTAQGANKLQDALPNCEIVGGNRDGSPSHGMPATCEP